MEGTSSTQPAGLGSPIGPSLFGQAIVQQVHGISTHNGDVVLAGGNVLIQHHYHHIHIQPEINILDVLRLVPNLRRIHLGVLSKATPGTGIWFLQTKHYLLWLDSNGNFKILWGTGIPGAGKSVMASIVINDLEARAAAAGGSICVAYVYFRYSEATDLTIRGVVEILVKQIVERDSNCAGLAEQAYAQHLRERTQPTEHELLNLLQHFTETFTATFYVLDALDEGPEPLRAALVKRLASLNVRLFITSRPLKGIEARIPQTFSFPILAEEDDIDLHIAQAIAESPALEDLLQEAEPSFQHEMILTVKKNCGEMFLHASLQLDAISQCTSPQDVMDTLQEFPSEIDHVYRQTWQRICQHTPKNLLLAQTVLVWVINATRSMTVDELRYAIATTPDTHKFQRTRLVPVATLVTLCCGFVTVEEETQFVRLVHYTARDTLQQLLNETFPHPHSLLAAVCMTHLTENGFQDTTITSEQEFIAVLQGDPLLTYASYAWATHAQKSFDIAKIEDQTATFVSNCRAFPHLIHLDHFEIFDTLGPLHVVAVHDLPLDLISHHGMEDPNIVTGIQGTTPLMLACWCGNDVMARNLLHLQNIDPNHKTPDGLSALIFAAWNGHEGIIKLLLVHPGIQVNAVDGQGQPVITVAAASSGHAGVVALLLACPDIQVNAANKEGRTALILAAANGNKTIVALLLAHPEIQVNIVDKDGMSALFMAAGNGTESTVTLLLEYPEIEVNAVDKDGWTPLMAAASSGQEGTVTLLLARPDTHVNTVDKAGTSALMMASKRNHTGVVKLLLMHSEVEPNAVDVTGASALVWAAYLGYEDIVVLLLARPALQINTIQEQGLSALMCAASQGHAGVVEYLLTRPEIEVNIVDNVGRSALSLAAQGGHRACVDLLLAFPGIEVDSDWGPAESWSDEEFPDNSSSEGDFFDAEASLNDDI